MVMFTGCVECSPSRLGPWPVAWGTQWSRASAHPYTLPLLGLGLLQPSKAVNFSECP